MATTTNRQESNTPIAEVDTTTFSRQGHRFIADARHQRRDLEIAELQELDGIRDRRSRRGGGRRRHEPERGRRVKNVDPRSVELDY